MTSPSPAGTRIAVLIDCDNVSPSYASLILEELASHGTPTIKRAYGDWTTTNLNGWKKTLSTLAIQPMLQIANTVGKNSSDSALIIDAMDLLWMGNVDTFAIVSSDSDFTRLAMRLRESGKRVIGLGARKTPASLRNAVDQFVYLELLKKAAEDEDEQADEASEETADEAAEPKSSGRSRSRGGRGGGGTGGGSRRKSSSAKEDTAGEAEKPARKETSKEAASGSRPDDVVPVFSDAEHTEDAPRINLQSALVKAINATSGDDGWASLGVIGQHLSRTHADFDPRDFGYRKLSDLVEDQSYLQTRTEGRTMEAAVKARRRRRAEG
ncbi:NYN domain-containing protein [Micrococcus luteus]